MEKFRLIAGCVLMGAGVLSIALAMIGVFKFKFVMNRMHCAAIIDTFGLAGILTGLMVISGSMEYIPKLLAALMLLWIGSPIASHLVGRMEIATDDTAAEYMETEDEADDGSL